MNRGFNLGNTWPINNASIVALPACMEGKAPKTIGELVNPGVYKAIPKSSSIRARPAGDPWIE